MQTLIGIQEEYIDTVNAAMSRWAHRRGIAGIANGIGGHAGRIVRGATRKAMRQLSGLGFTEEQARQAVRDAADIAALDRIAE